MDFTEVRTVRIGERDFPIKITLRASIGYQKQTGRSFTDFEGTEDYVVFFYHIAKAGAKAMNQEFDYDYEQFLDLLDDYPTETITNLSKAILGDEEPEPGGEEKKPMSSKK